MRRRGRGPGNASKGWANGREGGKTANTCQGVSVWGGALYATRHSLLQGVWPVVLATPTSPIRIGIRAQATNPAQACHSITIGSTLTALTPYVARCRFRLNTSRGEWRWIDRGPSPRHR